MLRSFFFVFTVLYYQFICINVAVADAAYIEQLIKRTNINTLAASESWRALLHYKPDILFDGWKSQADDAAFFLAPDGKTNPLQELIATMRAMDEPVLEDADEHPQCRFPARYYWLKQQIDIDPERLLPVECEELTTWFDTINPGSLTLVFPAAYINSPSSMFGHTLLRVNPADHRKDLPLVSYALNYAANADVTDNTLVFSIKGLIGGYPGVFSIVPYYEKIKEYSDLENRDVWEYGLSFSQQEINQLMRHTWEVRHIQFDYFFLTENCSYHMLSLMEVARPGLELTKHFDVKAIPSDTVRAVIDVGLVNDYQFRPSSTTVLSQRAAQLTEKENELAVAVTNEVTPLDSEILRNKPDITRAKIYEQSYDYARFLASADPTVRDRRAATNWKLLAARSQIKHDKVWQSIIEPKVRSEDGHATARVAVAAGKIDKSDYINLQFRPAYHDVLDPLPGYSNGAQINFLDLGIRYFTDSEQLRLDKLTVINVLSLTARDKYFDPISWGVDAAIERQPTRQSFTNAAQLVVNGGYSFNVPFGVVMSMLAEANIKAASRFDKGYTAGAGARLNFLLQSDRYAALFSTKAISFKAGENNLHQQLALSVSAHLDVNSSLRATFERIRDYNRYRSDFKLAWHKYF